MNVTGRKQCKQADCSNIGDAERSLQAEMQVTVLHVTRRIVSKTCSSTAFTLNKQNWKNGIKWATYWQFHSSGG
jgi:hypothetical protein